MTSKGLTQHLPTIIALLLCLYGKSSFAQITAMPSSGCAPLAGVQFTPPQGTTTATWTFGNGGSSNLLTPTATYANAGTYTVNFNGTVNGSSASFTTTVQVFSSPTANFTANPPTNGCVPLAVSFQDASSGTGGATITNWEWAFGDGGVSAGSATPTHTYNLSSQWDVTLKVTDNNGCVSSITKQDIVTSSALPNAVITSNPPSPGACNPPFTVDFSGTQSSSGSPLGTGLTYSWDFGNGQTSSLEDPPAITYTNFGTYTVTLTVSDDNGCANTRTITVPVESPVANLDVLEILNPNDTVCKAVWFINNSTGNLVSIDYGDGSPLDDTLFHQYANTGTYNVTLNVRSGNCTDDTTITIVVEEPTADFVVDPTFSCNDTVLFQLTDLSVGASDYFWVLPSGNTSTQQNPIDTFIYPRQDTIYTIDTPRVHNIGLFVISSNGCLSDTVFRQDTVWPPTAMFMPDVASGCAPLTVTFSDSSWSFSDLVNLTWYFDDGAATTSGPPATHSVITHTYNQPGDYYPRLVIENMNGCTDTSFFRHIEVGTPPSPNFSVSPQQVCPGEPVTITDLTPPGDSVDTWYYTGDNNELNHCYKESDAVWTYQSAAGLTDITLEVGYNGCFASVTQTDVVEILGPIGRFTYTCDCAAPFTINLNADISGTDSIVWDFGDGNTLGTTTDLTPTHTYSATGDYTVTLTSFNNTSGCQPFTYSMDVPIRNIQAVLSTDGIVCPSDTAGFNAGLSVDVDASCSKGYRWIWGDNSPPKNTDEPTITHAYPAGGGTYTLQLVVRDVNGCSDTAEQDIKAYAIDADFDLDTTIGCLPLTVTATDLTTSDTAIATWEWFYTDGQTSTLQNPTTTFTLNDTVNIVLVATNEAGCFDTMTKFVVPSVPDSNFFVVGRRTLCFDETTTFRANNLGLETYSWDFGDGTTSTDSVFVHSYNQAGSFTVSLTVTDSLGCTATNTRQNYVFVQAKPEAGFFSNADTIDELCYPIQLSYTDTSVNPQFGTRTWNLGNGSPIIPDQTVGTLYEQPGTYTVSLIVASSFGCRDTVERTFNVEGPVGDFDLSDSLICKGEEITFSIKDTAEVGFYAWDFGDGEDTSGVSPVTHQYNFNPPGGATVANLVMWSIDSACAYTVQKEVNIRQVFAEFDRNGETTESDTVHCVGLTDLFTNQSMNADTYEWSLGDGTTYTQAQPPSHVYETAGIYTVKLKIEDIEAGCLDSISKIMVINPLPISKALGGDTCQGDELTISVTGGDTYVWTPTEGLDDPSSATPIATPDSTTQYYVTVTDSNGCETQDSALVIVYQEPPSIEWDTLIVIGQEVQLDVDFGLAYTYSWDPTIWLSCSDCPNPLAQPLEDTTYTAIVADTIGCFEIPSTFRFEVKPETTIDVPTAFTPNGDGSNDIIFVNGWGIKSLLEFKIYNRWGQLVYEGNDITEGWDGTFQGQDQNIDTYTYTATVETWLEGEVLSKTGSFKLLR